MSKSNIYIPRSLTKSSIINESKIEPKVELGVKSKLDINVNITCIKCKKNHKFSPFNVTLDACINDLPKSIPMLIYNNKFEIIIVKNDDIKKYNHMTKEMIDKNEFSSNVAFYWSDGIDMFNNLITLLVNNNKMIDQILIDNLMKLIYCDNWWDEFLSKIAFHVNQSETLADSISRAEKYRDYTMSKNMEFPIFIRTLRTLRERQKRENEAVLQREQEEARIRKEEMDILRRQKENERLKEKELMEINKLSKEITFCSYEEKFINDLNTNKKTHNYKFLATINPDDNMIADLIIKAGEASNLQIGVDMEDKMNKIKVWEHYIQQEKNIKNGMKYKKPTWKKGNDIGIVEIPKDNVMMVLNNVQKIQYQQIYNTYLKEKENNKKNNILNLISSNTFVLDSWQIDAINHIRKNESCLIIGPTSGGKTYVMMKGLDNIINMNNNKNMVYVSPTFHLAYQTYANVKATFSKRIIAIITTELICIPKDANIYIGTASELLNYFVTTKKHFHVGIFDEIHVASKLYCEKDNKSDIIRASSYARLIARCKDQVIAASATIENEDGMRQFIVNQMNHCRENKITIEDIHLVKYHDRAIPLYEYRFVNNQTIQPLIRDINGLEINKNINDDEIIINAKNLFKLLIQMREKEMTPTIIFDNTDDIAWKSYVDLINYIEDTESYDYADYLNMISRINNIIGKFNDERNSKLDGIPDIDNCDASRIKDGKKGNSKRESGMRSIRNQRIKTIEFILNDSKTVLLRSIDKLNNEDNSKCQCIISKKNISSNIYNKLLEITDNQYTNLVFNRSHVDMLAIIQQFEDMESDQTEMITPLLYNKGSHYRFSNTSCGMEQLKAIREPGTNEENWKMRKKMILLAEAQHILPKDIDGIIDVIMRGLEFGISIINPSLPFVIQNIILENLRTKNMGIVFASESMSMGINYPLRSVVIKSSNGFTSINPGKMIQMAGRCGRRGKDNQAHVIYWGIYNAHQAHYSHISSISYPSDFIIDEVNELAGSMISDRLAIALSLGVIFKTLYFEDDTKKILHSALLRHHSNMNIDMDENRERSICKKRETGNVIFRSQYIEPVIKILAETIGFTKEEANNLASMISKIDNDIIMEAFTIESFKKSRDVNILLHMLIELHNTYTMSINTPFLEFLEHLIQILQVCEYRLIKLAN